MILFMFFTCFMVKIVFIYTQITQNRIKLHSDSYVPLLLKLITLEYTQSNLNNDPKINELLDWKNKEKMLNWLDSL